MSNAAEAIIQVLNDINSKPGDSVVIFLIGIELVIEQHFSQDEVLDGLHLLEAEKLIELLGNNTLRLLKPLTL
jgi:hypothetical protein